MVGSVSLEKLFRVFLGGRFRNFDKNENKSYYINIGSFNAINPKGEDCHVRIARPAVFRLDPRNCASLVQAQSHHGYQDCSDTAYLVLLPRSKCVGRCRDVLLPRPYRLCRWTSGSRSWSGDSRRQGSRCFLRHYAGVEHRHLALEGRIGAEPLSALAARIYPVPGVSRDRSQVFLPCQGERCSGEHLGEVQDRLPHDGSGRANYELGFARESGNRHRTARRCSLLLLLVRDTVYPPIRHHHRTSVMKGGAASVAPFLLVFFIMFGIVCGIRLMTAGLATKR